MLNLLYVVMKYILVYELYLKGIILYINSENFMQFNLVVQKL